MKSVLVFVLSVLLAYAVGSIASSLIIAGNVAEMGVAVGFGDRIGWVLHDLGGMAMVYLPIVLIGLGIGFAITAPVVRRRPHLRTVGYVLAGGVALLVIHQAIYLATSIHGLPATRTTFGLATQVLAGMAGGYLFARLGRPATD